MAVKSKSKKPRARKRKPRIPDWRLSKKQRVEARVTHPLPEHPKDRNKHLQVITEEIAAKRIRVPKNIYQRLPPNVAAFQTLYQLRTTDPVFEDFYQKVVYKTSRDGVSRHIYRLDGERYVAVAGGLQQDLAFEQAWFAAGVEYEWIEYIPVLKV